MVSAVFHSPLANASRTAPAPRKDAAVPTPSSSAASAPLLAAHALKAPRQPFDWRGLWLRAR